MSTEKIDVLKMQVAKALMEEGHKEAARAVLEVTSHPKASEWLVKLPKGKSASSTPGRRSPVFIGGIIGILLCVSILSFVLGRTSAPTPTLAELIAATPPPATAEFAATMYEATGDSVVATNNAASTALALTVAPVGSTSVGN